MRAATHALALGAAPTARRVSSADHGKRTHVPTHLWVHIGMAGGQGVVHACGTIQVERRRQLRVQSVGCELHRPAEVLLRYNLEKECVHRRTEPAKPSPTVPRGAARAGRDGAPKEERRLGIVIGIGVGVGTTTRQRASGGLSSAQRTVGVLSPITPPPPPPPKTPSPPPLKRRKLLSS